MLWVGHRWEEEKSEKEGREGNRRESMRQPQVPNLEIDVSSASQEEPRDDFKEQRGIARSLFQRDTPSGSSDGWELGVRLR